MTIIDKAKAVTGNNISWKYAEFLCLKRKILPAAPALLDDGFNEAYKP